MTQRFGIIGAGMIAKIHADAIDRMNGATLTGIHDNGKNIASTIAPHVDTTGADNLTTFLQRNDIDIVTIATPSGTHAEIAVRAATHGKHVICEKPLDVTSDAIDRMISACDDAGVALGGVFNTRYNEAAQLIRQASEQGRFGRLTFGQALGPWWREQSYYDDSDWKGTWRLDGGGALMNQGIHTVDMLQWLMNSPVEHVNANMATLAHERVEVEDTVSASVQFQNGALGMIGCTTSMWPGHFRTITIAGTDGTVVLAEGNLLQWHFKNETAEDERIREQFGGLPRAAVGASDPAASVDSDGHLAVFQEFTDALAAGRKPAVDGAQARKSVEIILAIYESARGAGRRVKVRA